MAMFTGPLEAFTGFEAGDVEWLHLLVGDWQLVADLAFADLVLWFPAAEGGFVALAHVRPSTGLTVFHADPVGEPIPPALKDIVQKAWDTKSLVTQEDVSSDTDDGVRIEAVPMVRGSRPLAVITSHFDLSSARMPSRLELTYRQSARDLLAMGALGLWPDFATPTGGKRGAPRVGDGFMRLDVEGKVLYASPNAVSAFRRLGTEGALEGNFLAEITAGLLKDRRLIDETLPLVLTGRMPWRTEVESRGVALTLRAIPLRNTQGRFGSLVLCRDVSELRRREKELVSKDATIREIHHRVKNNLQTVAALLRMQSRRMNSDEGRMGLEQAMRRVSTIALVHETLSQGLTQEVEFDEMIERQFHLSAEVASNATNVRTRMDGSFGDIPSDLATPLALVINELVTNSVEHGLPDGGEVRLVADRTINEAGETILTVQVIDNGVGMENEPGREGLGLQIVRTLVTSELSGTIQWAPAKNGGTAVTLVIPLKTPKSTVQNTHATRR